MPRTRPLTPVVQAAPPAARPKQPMREHHEECDGELYEGGTCTCDLIERLGPPSERVGYGDDF
ncbi:hypothetical protein [Streptomyces microflavus]|uniref:hypothetical protein n=1 Tax=Streptomyces microflavus TaxID=1919 RepID=UPI003B216B5C